MAPSSFCRISPVGKLALIRRVFGTNLTTLSSRQVCVVGSVPPKKKGGSVSQGTFRNAPHQDTADGRATPPGGGQCPRDRVHTYICTRYKRGGDRRLGETFGLTDTPALKVYPLARPLLPAHARPRHGRAPHAQRQRLRPLPPPRLAVAPPHALHARAQLPARASRQLSAAP